MKTFHVYAGWRTYMGEMTAPSLDAAHEVAKKMLGPCAVVSTLKFSGKSTITYLPRSLP